jgi:hypothetical protein
MDKELICFDNFIIAESLHTDDEQHFVTEA